MPDLDIGSLPAADTLTGAELVHGVQSGNSRKVTASQLATYAASVAPSLTAADIGSDATGDVAATNVQDAIAELDDEKLSLEGGTITVTNPSNGTASSHTGLNLTVTYDEDALSDSSPEFSNLNGLGINVTADVGQNVYGGGTLAKKTFIPLNVNATFKASGQRFALVRSLLAYGMGDSFLASDSMTFAGGPISGDEGQGFTAVSRLQQLDTLAKPTISSVPAQSSANTTTTQAITKSQNIQAVTVASVTGISVGDWVVVGQEVAVGTPNLEAVEVTAVGAGSISGRFLNNHTSGVTVTPALVLNLANTNLFGEGRVLVNLSGSSYATGTVSGISGNTFTGSGTSWADNVVGGNTGNVGAIALDSDTFTGSPFSVGSPLRSWYQIKAVASGTSLTMHSYSTAGATAYVGQGVGTTATYTIRPAARVLRINGNQVICETSTHTWTAGDTVECTICPYPDVNGNQHRIKVFTTGGNKRSWMDVQNTGARKIDSAFVVHNDSYLTTSNFDTTAWEQAFYTRGGRVKYGFRADKATDAGLRLSSAKAGDGSVDNSGKITWDLHMYLAPNSTNNGMSFRTIWDNPAFGTDGTIDWYASAKSDDGLDQMQVHGSLVTNNYIRFGVFTAAALAAGTSAARTAAEAGAGAIVYCSDGGTGGTPCLMQSDGSTWTVVGGGTRADKVSALTDGATPALNAALGNIFTLAAGGDRTIAVPTNATNGQRIVIRHLASGGARTLALNSGAGGFRFGTDITGLAATSSGKTDYITCIYSSIDSFWDVVAYAKGY